MTNFNERANTLLYKDIALTFYSRKGCERVDVGYVWEMSWRREQTATYWPKVLLTIATLLSRPGWAAQLWVTEGLQADSHAGILSPNWLHLQLELQLTQAACGIWLYNCLKSTCFLWAYASAPNSATSTGQGDIPISSTGWTCFAVLPLIYTGASLDWRLRRGSICYIRRCLQPDRI